MMQRSSLACDAPHLAELVASRFAHELVGSVGAVSNGLELMEDLGADAGEDAASLVRRSAREAGARLQFYRIAYGRAGYALTSLAQLRAAAANFFETAPHHSLAWPLPPVLPSLSDGVGRLLLLGCEIARDALPRGGEVHVSTLGASLTVRALGQGAILSDDLNAAATGTADPEALTPRTVHGALLHCFGQEIGWRIEVQRADGEVLVGFSS